MAPSMEPANDKVACSDCLVEEKLQSVALRPATRRLVKVRMESSLCSGGRSVAAPAEKTSWLSIYDCISNDASLSSLWQHSGLRPRETRFWGMLQECWDLNKD